MIEENKMSDIHTINDIRELYKRIDGIKNTQIEIQKELLDLQKKQMDNLQRDFDNNKELQDKIKNIAKTAGIKWGAIITAIGGAIATILQVF